MQGYKGYSQRYSRKDLKVVLKLTILIKNSDTDKGNRFKRAYNRNKNDIDYLEENSVKEK
jgi:hypothetical protein